MSTKTDIAVDGAAPGGAAQVGAEATAAPPSPAGRAIVVDDDALLRFMLSDALQARGFEVQTAEDATAGLRLLSESILTLDVLITDVLMPGQDGIEFVRTIRTLGGESELVLVAVTASADPSHRTRLIEAGADFVLDKSIGVAAIAQAVGEVVL